MIHVPLQISNFFLAMQVGRAGADALEACFDEKATYSVPFTGQVRTHHGKKQIMQAMSMGWREAALEDARIHIDTVATRDGSVIIQWTCYSPSLPGGKGCGTNVFTLENGLITSLITTLKEEE